MRNKNEIRIFKMNNKWFVCSKVSNPFITDSFEKACEFAKIVNNWDYEIKQYEW